MVIGWCLIATGYFVVNHTQTMKMFGARSLWDLKMSVVAGAALIILSGYFSSSLGLLGRALVPGLSNPDLIYPRLVDQYLVSGLKGIVVAGMIASAVSTFEGRRLGPPVGWSAPRARSGKLSCPRFRAAFPGGHPPPSGPPRYWARRATWYLWSSGSVRRSTKRGAEDRPPFRASLRVRPEGAQSVQESGYRTRPALVEVKQVQRSGDIPVAVGGKWILTSY